MKALAETHGIELEPVRRFLARMLPLPLPVTVAPLTRDENHPAVASRILEAMQA